MRTVVIERGEPGYPPSLLELADPPDELHVRGQLGQGPAAAIVGTRAASPAAHAFAERLAADLVRLGVVVISGGARGIDGASHEGALGAGGATIAVLATGVDVAYPREHAGLFERIAREGGALVSERPLGATPLPGAFPARNRIIAALAACTIVVEAPARSGALSTARAAQRLGRPVLAVPARPDDPRAAGCLALLRGGALVCAGARDVLDVLARRPTSPPARIPPDTPRLEDALARRKRAAAGRAAPPAAPATGAGSDERLLLALLSAGDLPFDALCARSGLGAARVRAALGMLDLAGLVTEKPGDAFGRRGP